MTIIRYNNREVTLAPDLTLELQNERKLRQLADIDVVEQTSNLVTIANARIDSLVQRMNNFESGAGAEWAVPLQKEKDDRIAGDSDNRNFTNALNTSMTNRVNGLFNDIVAVEDRVTTLEQADPTIIRQGNAATLDSLKVNKDVTGQTASFANQVTVGSLNNLSDHPWTKVQNYGDNMGVWFKRQGDMVSVRMRLQTGAAKDNNVLCNIPSWAQLPGTANYMFVVSPWSVDASPAYQLQVHGDMASDPSRNIIEMLKSPPNTVFEFTINYSVGDMPT